MLTALSATIAVLGGGCTERSLPFTGSQAQSFGDGSALSDAGEISDLNALPDGASVAACAADNTLFVDGDPGEPLHPGAETVPAATWMPLNGGDLDTFAALIPAGDTQWEIAFSTLGLNQPLTPGSYPNAGTWPSSIPSATLHIYPDRDPPPICRSVTGWFYISSIAGGPTSAQFNEIVAAFEQHCDGSSAALRGCIHLRR
jgi:hypothetical protein